MNVVDGHEEPLLGYNNNTPEPAPAQRKPKVKFNNKGKIINIPSAFAPRVAKPKLPGNKECGGKCGRTISGNKNFCLACVPKEASV